MALQGFLNLPAEKQQELLDCCLQEFSMYGYDLASTNRIVEHAGISKGALFKYFGSKEKLYLHTFNFYAERVLAATLADPQELPHDFLEAIKYLGMKKIKFFGDNPLASKLFLRAAQQPEHPVYAKALQSINSEKTAEVMQYLITNLLKKDLRPGASVERILLLLNWVSDGLRAKFLPNRTELPDDAELDCIYQQILREMDCYFDLIKHGIYQHS